MPLLSADSSAVVFLHGGPGGSTNLKNTIFFDPSVYRVILFDQRGAGRSLPSGELQDNTSRHPVSDIEALQGHFRISRWHVFGGSWGAVLSLLYTQAHPEVVLSLTVRGVSFPDPQVTIDSHGFFRRMRTSHPEAYSELIEHLSDDERKDITSAYLKRTTSGDAVVELAAAKAYHRTTGAMSKLSPGTGEDEVAMTPAEEHALLSRTRIDLHYNAHHKWLDEMQYSAAEQLNKIQHIPCSIVNRQDDMACPASGAWRLHKALPQSRLFIIPNAGHSAYVSFISLSCHGYIVANDQ